MPELSVSDSVRKLTRPHIKSLTSLRFIAALLIFFLHAANHGFISSSYFGIFDLSKSVCFFFVLSGFVLGYAYYGRDFIIRSFYIARLLRVWPATLTALLFVITFLPRFIYLPNVESSVSSYIFTLVVHILCLQSLIPIPSTFFAFNAVAWSVSAEIVFYFIFPRINQLKLNQLCHVFLLFASITLFSSFLIANAAIPAFSLSNLDGVAWEGILYINPLIRLPEFILGIISARMYCILSKSRNKLLLFRSARLESFWEFFLFLILSYYAFAFRSNIEIAYIKHVVNQLSSAILFSLLLLNLACFKGFASNLLSSKLLVFFGKISFGFYLYHQPLMIRAAQLNGLKIGAIQFLPNNIIAVFIWSIFLSVVSYYLIEKILSRRIELILIAYR